jgi:anti-anti-sigma regulatory factor
VGCPVAPVADISLNPFVLDFGAVAVGGSATLNAVIQNLDTANLNVTAISLCAPTSTEFI